MRIIRLVLMIAVIAGLTACAKQDPKFLAYNGPDVTSIVVQKENRRMFLMNGDSVIKAFSFELGFNPVGHKEVELDGRTPEGAYYINRRNPNSQYHLSLGISYPNAQDRAHAAAMGKPPGGDIFIHGTPRAFSGKDDWTYGCIAVTDAEIEQIYAMVKDGTPIFIYP